MEAVMVGACPTIDKGKTLANHSPKKRKVMAGKKKFMLVTLKCPSKETKETPLQKSLRLFTEAHLAISVLLRILNSTNTIKLHKDFAELSAKFAYLCRKWEEAESLKTRIEGVT